MLRNVTMTLPKDPAIGWVRFPDGSRLPLVDGMTIPAGSMIETVTVDKNFGIVRFWT